MQILKAQDAQRPLPAASISKLLIAIALVEAAAPALLKRNRIRIRGNDGSFGGGSLPQQFSPGDQPTITELMSTMLIDSNNVAANALMDYLGLATINNVAYRPALRDTRIHGHFLDTPAPVVPHGYTCAEDCTKMLAHIVSGARGKRAGCRTDLYKAIISDMESSRDHRFISYGKKSLDVAQKTGEISGELNDVAITNPYGREPVLIAVLAHGPFSVRDQAGGYRDAVDAMRRKVQKYLRTVARPS